MNEVAGREYGERAVFPNTASERASLHLKLSHFREASRETRSEEVHLEAKNLCRAYRKGSNIIPVLRGVNLEVRRGEFLSIVGQSGCGKSTLLHILATLDVPDQGEVYFQGNRVDDLLPVGRDVLRNKYLGMIFQFYHLLPELTALENVLTPMMISHGVFGYFRNRARFVRRATALLEQVGLGHRLRHKPRELSGGEMQRAAVARALVAKPEILFADEPTGNLDRSTGSDILKLLRSLNQEQKLTIVMVTHDETIAEQADRVIRLTEGQVELAAGAAPGAIAVNDR